MKLLITNEEILKAVKSFYNLPDSIEICLEQEVVSETKDEVVIEDKIEDKVEIKTETKIEQTKESEIIVEQVKPEPKSKVETISNNSPFAESAVPETLF